MKNAIPILFLVLSIEAFAQIEPAVTYDGGDLYFVPARLTSEGTAFMYSYRNDYESGKTWFTIFDDEVNVVEQVEIEAEVLNYSTRTVTSQRRFFAESKNGGTRATSETEYFLDDWTVVSDVFEEKTEYNNWIEGPEVLEDNNNYHSRQMYLSQTLFNEDDDFEFLRAHYEVMPLSYCAADDNSGPGNDISMERPSFGGETCDEYTMEYNHDLGGYVFTLIKHKVYGGIKNTGTDVVSLNGTIKKTLNGVTSFGTVVSINGKFYVSAYDRTLSKYALYKIATATTSISKVAEITSETRSQATYNTSGLRVKSNTKGVVIRNGQKIVNK